MESNMITLVMWPNQGGTKYLQLPKQLVETCWQVTSLMILNNKTWAKEVYGLIMDLIELLMLDFKEKP